MRLRCRRFLDDVHRLASRYHWGEGEILSLPLPRRQAYLVRIETEKDAALLHALGEG